MSYNKKSHTSITNINNNNGTKTHEIKKKKKKEKRKEKKASLVSYHSVNQQSNITYFLASVTEVQ